MTFIGFSTTVRSSDTQETALHRCVLCLHYTKIRRLSEKIRQMINLLQDCLPLQDTALQTPLHAAATKLITGNKSDYYEECLRQMVAKAIQIPGKTAEILNARDLHGNTALHYLAQNEIGLVALRAIIDGGGDISVRNKKKLTPLNIALNNGCTRVIKILSTAHKNSKHSSRYDSSIYTTDSPPESPVNPESLENSQNEQPHVEHPYSLPKGGSSSHDLDVSALDDTEDSSFSANDEEAPDELPLDATQDEVPTGSSDDTHTEQPGDIPASDINDPSSCVTSDSPADVTDDDPSSVKENAPCHNTDDTLDVANNSTSIVTENVLSEVRDESISNVTDGDPGGVPDDAPAGVTNDAPVDAPVDAPDNAPVDVPDNAPAGVTDTAPCGDTDNASSGVPDNAPADAPDNAPADVPDDAPDGVTDETSSVNADNVHSGTGDVPSGNLNTVVETPPAACNDPDEETDFVSSDYESPSDNESELAGHYATRGNNAVGVQTPGIDPYSCIVHIKQEMVSPVSGFFLFFYLPHFVDILDIFSIVFS